LSRRNHSRRIDNEEAPRQRNKKQKQPDKFLPTGSKRPRIDPRQPASSRSSAPAVPKLPKIYQNADEAIAEMENQQNQFETKEQQHVTKRKAAAVANDKQNKDADDDNSTASENDLLVDKNMEQDILKQLEALR
jgi:hypothetical protein